MKQGKIKKILDAIKKGHLSTEKALGKLKTLPFEDLHFAKIDHHRHLRTGLTEVVFCEGKSDQDALAIIKKVVQSSKGLLATRASMHLYRKVKKCFPKALYHQRARVIVINRVRPSSKKSILVLCAGTSDIPVAEEAAVTAEFFGNNVERIYDVGVAGLHRLLDQVDAIHKARVLVVVAGMEGALPSVVAGLAGKPVVAVPTSVGYGANFGGLTPLLAMLNSCAAGVTVVNIDNGFGAGVAAHLINKT